MTANRVPMASLQGWLLTALFFLVTTPIAALFWLVVLALLVLWLAEGRFTAKWQALRASGLFWVYQAYFWLLVLGLAWTEDMASGGDAVARAAPLALLAPVLLTVQRQEHQARHVNAFLLGIAASVALSSYSWLQLNVMTDWPAGIRMHRSVEDTAPFVDRVLYTPMLAMGGYLCARAALAARAWQRWAYALLLLAIVSNLIFSGGRTGVLAFLALLMLLAVQRSRARPLVGLAIGAALAAAVMASGYLLNAQFRERVHLAVDQTLNYRDRVDTSVGLRINLAINSLRAFAQSPWFGAGTGDFEAVYRAVNERHTPQWQAAANPHNQFLLSLVTNGAAGGIALLLVYLPPGLWRGSGHAQRDAMRVAVAVWICIISLFESYLWRSNTGLLLIMLCTMLYAGPDAAVRGERPSSRRPVVDAQ